jgi:uncharacterized protein
MIFLDTSVLVYAVGRSHPLREPARTLLLDTSREPSPLVTSAEVLQELLNIYLPVDRWETLEAAWNLVHGVTRDIWPVEAEDLDAARLAARANPQLQARDLVHLASCRRRGVRRIHTFDRGLKAALEGRSGTP